MALNPLDEIRNLGAPEDLGGGLPMGGGLPDMGGGPSGTGGGMPIPSGPAMGGGMPIDPTVGAGALDFAMGAPPDLGGIPIEGLGDQGLGGDLGGEASTDEAATQVANVIVEMAPSPDEAMNLANAISEKVASIVMGEDMGAEDRLMELGMQFGGNLPLPPALPGRPPPALPGGPPPSYGGYGPPKAAGVWPTTLPQQFGQQSWLGPQGQGGSGRMGPPVGGGYQDGGRIREPRTPAPPARPGYAPPGTPGRTHVPGLVGRSSYHSDAREALRRNPPPRGVRDIRGIGPGYQNGGGIGSLMMQGGGQMAPGFNPPGGPGQAQGRLSPQEVRRVVGEGRFSPEEIRRMGPQGRGRPTGPPRRPPPRIRPGY